MSHARQYPRMAGSNIKVLNDDNIATAWIRRAFTPYPCGAAMCQIAKGGGGWDGKGVKTHLGGGSLVPGSGRSPVSEEGGGN
jgi:hypothetical protein